MEKYYACTRFAAKTLLWPAYLIILRTPTPNFINKFAVALLRYYIFQNPKTPKTWNLLFDFFHFGNSDKYVLLDCFTWPMWTFFSNKLFWFHFKKKIKKTSKMEMRSNNCTQQGILFFRSEFQVKGWVNKAMRTLNHSARSCKFFLHPVLPAISLSCVHRLTLASK